MFKFSKKSLDKMEGVSPSLILLAKHALDLSEIDFGVSEGLRTKERQKELVEAGKSLTMDSKHIIGKAIDVVAYVDGKVTWDFDKYALINEAFKEASLELDIPFVWGGSWKRLKDGVHFELKG